MSKKIEELTKEELEAYGNAYWADRQAFIAAGNSERFESYCLGIDPKDETKYVFKVEQIYNNGSSGMELPSFDNADDAIAYLEAAPFPGRIQRSVSKDGKPSWLTAGIAYQKHAGIRDYWEARNKMRDQGHWHPDLGQTGPEGTPCPYCYPTGEKYFKDGKRVNNEG